MTTNASLLSIEKARFLLDNNCNFVFSFDGPESVHNENRRFAANGSGSYKRVYENIKK